MCFVMYFWCFLQKLPCSSRIIGCSRPPWGGANLYEKIFFPLDETIFPLDETIFPLDETAPPHGLAGAPRRVGDNANVFSTQLMMQKWCKNDTKMIQKWYTNDAKMIQKWCKNDAKMMQKWYKNDAKIYGKRNIFELSPYQSVWPCCTSKCNVHPVLIM